MIDCIESYLRLTSNELKLYFFEGGHVKKFDPNNPPDFEAEKQKLTKDTPFGYDATGADDTSGASSYSIIFV